MTEEVNQQDKWLEIIKDLFLKTKKVGLIPKGAYSILESKGEIDLTEEEWQMIADQVGSRLQQEAAREGTKALKEFAHLKSSPLYESVFVDECRRQAVANYFTVQQEIDNF